MNRARGKIAVIGAMEQEVERLRAALHNAVTTEIAGCEFTEGTYGGAEVVLLKSGIGKVNAAMATSLLLQAFHPDAVLNTGSAGGFDPELSIGTVIISDEVRHHDVDVTAFGYERGQVPGMPAAFRSDERLVRCAARAVEEVGEHRYAVGLITTGDSFMDKPARVEEARHHFPTMKAAEMEAAAVAQVCHCFGVPFVVIRALSDIAGQQSSISFDEFLPTAAAHSTAVVLRAIVQLQEHGMLLPPGPTVVN